MDTGKQRPRLAFIIDEIASIGASFGASVAFPELAKLALEREQELALNRYREQLAEEDRHLTDPVPIGQVFEQLGNYIPGFLDGIRAATSHDGEPPTDPRARALWLRKNPNTGPKPRRRRPPKNLMP